MKYAIGLALGVMLFATAAQADIKEFVITIQDHKFAPAELEVPAKEKVKLVIENKDATPEEFESYDLNREKVVGGNSKIVVFVGPLEPGEYKFFGEFNEDSAQGKIVVR
ncbi:MAG: cupredoxin domain-containing protein [Bdellovibrionales bacterium]|nr:cupredoxin domain-containing protein [Bdellovibrionales bacterium]